MWNGSTPLACARGFRAWGHSVAELNPTDAIPPWRSRALRALLRVLDPLLVGEYNAGVVRLCEEFRPHLFFTVKGLYLTVGTLEKLKLLQIPLYNYYPDVLGDVTHHHLLRETMTFYDCVFLTKKFQIQDAAKWSVRNCRYIPHGYSPDVHRPMCIPGTERRRRGAPVVYTANHTKYKEDLLAQLIDRLPSVQMRIYGNGWLQRCRSSKLKPFIQGWAPTGDEYSCVLQCGDINLGIMIGPVPGARQGDETTTRTFEIPACKSFMLHERTPELATFFEEGSEVACFQSPQELADQISFFLAHPELRSQIAEAGYKRCVPAYSYEARVKQMLEYHLASPKDKLNGELHLPDDPQSVTGRNF
jgi:glycosyltransferase involved in cell wall biosynthesis